MWEWKDKLKLGKSSPFVKRELRELPLTDAEFEAILTKTDIAKTKKLRPRLEAMAAEGKAIELDISDWGIVVSALCAPTGEGKSARRRLLKMATTIADHLAEALGIEGPALHNRK